ncbi:MAG: GNAT family N-acetyltransferase [bacterium]|nr:GNAT family N-acetyltransferase [bacterium]
MWIWKTFDQLTPTELHAIYQLRIAVFVVEQNCPYQEVDDADLIAHHLFYRDKAGQLLAYCRLIPAPNQVKLGRVLVAPNQRGTGLGQELLGQALTYWQATFPKKDLFAQAQAYLEDFYQQFGFESCSAIYLDDNIPHIDMKRRHHD